MSLIALKMRPQNEILAFGGSYTQLWPSALTSPSSILSYNFTSLLFGIVVDNIFNVLLKHKNIIVFLNGPSPPLIVYFRSFSNKLQYNITTN